MLCNKFKHAKVQSFIHTVYYAKFRKGNAEFRKGCFAVFLLLSDFFAVQLRNIYR